MLKPIIIFFVILTLCTCIDPYTPDLSGYASLMVVDGLITDANESYKVKLSRSFQEQNSQPPAITDATVFITDDIGNKAYLINSGNGIYKTDSTEFKGIPGRTYTLNIVTNEGNVYESNPCPMQSVPDIESIYYAKDQALVNNGTETEQGVSFYLDSKTGDDNTFYRWDYEETWKFKVPYPTKFNYISEKIIIPNYDIKDFCWKTNRSDEILVRSSNTVLAGQVKKEQICFITSEKSDRLTIQYSILIKQYSISEKEYDFWDNLKRLNLQGGDIFAAQPYSVTSNISCVNKSSEPVLGYFRVSSVRQKRVNLSFAEITNLDLPLYHSDCVSIKTSPADYCVGGSICIPPTWDELYEMWVHVHYVFVEPFYEDPVTKKLAYLVFTKPRSCADCEVTGTRKKPDFWVDLN
jgi:hypothetical protein